jgi:hypothetical protein
MKNLRGIMIPAEFSNLPFGEQLLLWSIRLWVRALKDETNAHDILSHGFKLAGVPKAHLALNGLMTVIATMASGNIDIRCTKCAEISEDEHLLMGAVASRQFGGNPSEAASFIAHWFADGYLPHTYEPTTALAEDLKKAGLWIRQRCITERSHDAEPLIGEFEEIPTIVH